MGIDVEEADWDNANFGSVIHSILERAVKIAKEKGDYPDIKFALDEFHTGMDNSLSFLYFFFY